MLFVVIIQAVIGNPYVALAAISVLALPGLALAAQLPARVEQALRDAPGTAPVAGQPVAGPPPGPPAP